MILTINLLLLLDVVGRLIDWQTERFIVAFVNHGYPDLAALGILRIEHSASHRLGC